LSLSSCNTVKYVAENEHLLTKNTITVNEKKNVEDDINSYVIQRPNRLTLGVPVALNFYNWGNKDLEEKYLKGIDTFAKKRDRPKEFKKFKYKFNHWKFKNGEAPVILDSTKTKLTTDNLKQHFISQGYFRTKVDYKEARKKNKRATVDYTINTGNAFLLDSVSENIKSPVLDSLFQLHKNKTFIKTNDEFRDSNFENEADRITQLYRNSGVYHFTRSAIGYKADSTKNSYKVDVKLNIGDRIIERNDSIFTAPYKIQKISKVDVFTDYSFNKKEDPYTKIDSYNGIDFHAHDELKYNSKLLSNSIFIEPKNIYKDDDRDLTRKNLRGLQNFKSVKIAYEEIDSANIAAKIYLTPYKKYSFSANTELTHSNIKQLGVSGKISTLNRNTFRGSEILRFSIQGSFFNTSRDAGDNTGGFFNAFEFGGDVSLELPRILFPANTEKLISKKMSPKTKISIGTSFQKNIGLDKQKFTGIIDYNWQSSKNKKHRFELLNAQFIKNKNINSYFNIYRSEYNSLELISNNLTLPVSLPTNREDLSGIQTYINYILDTNNGIQNSNPTEYQSTQNIGKRKDIITEDALVPVISYEYTYNNSNGYQDADFSFFRARVASSGLLSSSLTTKKNTETGRKEILGIPVAQYIKTDFEYKKFWGSSSDNLLAFRSLLGIAIPYGNSEEMPFSRSYFIGGANDLRAWKIYDIGPGSIQNGLEYNVGSLKFLSSLEYRFKIINSVKGALFIDAGNIWDITKTDLIAEEGRFNGLKSLNQIAVGTGFGVRYDFNFLVIRLDLGFKTYEPYLDDNSKWLSNYNFGNAVYNIGINYPF
jgi:outer membrane protein assembly factor BamA